MATKKTDKPQKASSEKSGAKVAPKAMGKTPSKSGPKPMGKASSKAAPKPMEKTPSKTATKAAAKAEADPQTEQFLRELERGTLELKIDRRADIAQTFTKDNVEKFILGDITWAQLMGMTMEEAYNIAEYGYSLYQEARYHDAKTVFEGLVYANPYDAYFHNMLGAVYQQLDFTDEALEQYGISIDLDPEFMHPLVNRGEMYLNEKRFDEAASDFKKAIALDPKGDNPLLARARLLSDATQTVLAAIQRYLKATAGEKKP